MILKLTFGQCVSLIFMYFIAKEVVWFIFHVLYTIAKSLAEQKKNAFDSCNKHDGDRIQTGNDDGKEKKRPIGFRSIEDTPRCKEDS